MNLPIGPRIRGNFELSARRGPNSLAYDLTLTSTVGNDNYDLRGEVLAGPKKYGLILEVRVTSFWRFLGMVIS